MMERILWKEGLFLRPQHFQQQDQMWLQMFQHHFQLRGGHAWGLSDFAFQRNLLSKGEVSISRLEGVMVDGVAFMLNGQEQDLTLRLDKNIAAGFVCLVLAKINTEGLNVSLTRDIRRRFFVDTREVSDELQEMDARMELQVVRPYFHLCMVQDLNELSAYVALPLLQVLEVRDSGEVVINDDFIPPLLYLNVSEHVQGFVKEIAGLLSLRRMKLLDRIGGVDQYGVAGISELLLLQLINRYEPLLEHYRCQSHLHPEIIYQLFLQLAGELRTFTSEDRSYAKPPIYDHLNLRVCFFEVMKDLRVAFNYVFDEPAVFIPFANYKHNLYLASFHERVNFDYQRLVLAVRADMPLAQLRNLFPTHAKLGPLAQIKDLVTLQIPGMPLHLLPVAPRQIPYHSDFVYFELDNQSEMWLKLKESSALALHLSGGFANVEISLWAVKS